MVRQEDFPRHGHQLFRNRRRSFHVGPIDFVARGTVLVARSSARAVGHQPPLLGDIRSSKNSRGILWTFIRRE